jgi:TatD DNase family protein
MIIDSHCHLDYPSLYENLEEVVKRAEFNKVNKLLTICTTLESFEKIKLIIEKYKNIYGTFGIHPHESKKYKNIDSKFILNLKKKI